ncbi:AAA family ATPase [Glaciecola sp. KUL10]|uniref:AAA family ATPase n=1 Tax=Glaciecola sp. (strain KUL10) TaxID=2161813 RepID=UPI0013140993|nr:AAA family ATPase [Glaciecola sp. KUL10]
MTLTPLLGIESTTLASLLNELGKGNSQAKFKDTVILLDEAGQLATPDLLQLMQAAHSAGAKLVLVGEQQQMDAITHGGSLRYLSQRQGCARINTIRRQREAWARTAVNDLRSGNAKAALDTFAGKDLLHIEQDSQSAREQLVKHWQAYTEANPDKQTMIMAQRWKDVKPLNDLVRTVYQEQGKLGTENILTECVVSNQSLYFAFSKGERVRFTKNDYKKISPTASKAPLLKCCNKGMIFALPSSSTQGAPSAFINRITRTSKADCNWCKPMPVRCTQAKGQLSMATPLCCIPPPWTEPQAMWPEVVTRTSATGSSMAKSWMPKAVRPTKAKRPTQKHA